MAGIYIHIPFCRQACHYCDFHFSTNLRYQSDMVEAMCREIGMRKDYLDEEVHTVYFGGGTPSLLSREELESIFKKITESFKVNEDAEVTLEANPEDLTAAKLADLMSIGINRLSIGVQSFRPETLKWMNRAHSVDEVTHSYTLARKTGFENISLDLIYAIPGTGVHEWREELERTVTLNPEHISIYGLTIEERTVFGKWKKEDKLKESDEQTAAAQYLETIEYLAANGFAQYEVSNFSKPGFGSRHNAAYWAGVPYLGVGPGAHSYDGVSRQFNTRNNPGYIRAIKNGDTFFEKEELSPTQLLNEKILTQLRTAKGLDLGALKEKHGVDIPALHGDFLADLVAQQMATQEHGKLRLLPRGFLVADEVALKLFF